MKNISLISLTGTLLVAALMTPLAVSSGKKKKNEKSGAGKGSASAGQAIFKKNCEMCHFADKSDKKLGPGLKELFKSKELPESHKPATEANVREQIEKGSPDAKPMPMPAFAEKLTEEEMQNLLAYLKTL